MKNILVIGGAGYIGSVVVEELLKKNYSVVVYDNLSTGHKQAINCKFVKADIKNKRKLSETMKEFRIDLIMHLGGLIVVPNSMQTPRVYFDTNVSNSLNILDAMVENNVKKIIFSSSAAVYGEPSIIPITEECETNPTNFYGETKLIFEKLLKWYSLIYGIKYVSLRYFNACGATKTHGEDHSPETHLIPLIFETIMGKKKFISIFGTDYETKDGTCIRDYVHVRDIADAHILSINYGDNAVFNLGNGRGYSVKEVLTSVERITNTKISLNIQNRRVGDCAVLVASSNLAKKELKWQAKMDINDIISSAWAWKQKHPNGY